MMARIKMTDVTSIGKIVEKLESWFFYSGE